ncbi:protein of unknown function [endosymbiont DhMRE of Dentiscutata heterogama]|uniref:hypothetical protein n=1 Tax=endosymbiont DhMRE of Dentiscutata heterogama TaxID=1609546 RepID=UPI000629DBB8|nr:hypothetical protein [endosymbiont DhMRE of Dentiscutata heterogama]CFW93403.1 protein of unknown function [endosymbiont DhMRE of Dentiscutata heterogama]
MDREASGPGKGNIREEKRGEYPEMASTHYHAVAILMLSLEDNLGIPPKKYTPSNITKKIKLVKKYKENVSFRILMYGSTRDFPIEEYEKLFREWKLYVNNLS